jgi:hypothetical protein
MDPPTAAIATATGDRSVISNTTAGTQTHPATHAKPNDLKETGKVILEELEERLQ